MQHAGGCGAPTLLDAGPAAGSLSAHSQVSCLAPKQVFFFSHAKTIWQIATQIWAGVTTTSGG